MSAPLPGATISSENPITSSTARDTLANLGLSLDSKPGDLEAYTTLLQGVWEVWNKVDHMDDYVPVVDEERFPRTAVFRPEGAENEWHAWAWKALVRDTSGKSRGGLLDGKTLCLKDNIALKGVPCLLGTEVFTGWTPNTDATVATRVLEAGAVITGKAVCENLSLWGVSSSAATGPIDNALAPGFSAGGSSSGCAVLLQRRAVDLAIGGDQGGSVRIPASCCGLVGMKPTHGLVPYTGVASLEPVLDHLGPMSRGVLENALLLRVIAGADGIDDRQQAGCPFPGAVPDYAAAAAQGGVSGMKIGILTEGLDRPLADARVSELVVKAAKAFEKLGAVVEEVSVPMHKDAPDLWAVIGRLSASTSLANKACGRRQLFLNDLTSKLAPLDQGKLDKMFCSGVNTLVNGAWGWDNMPRTLLGKATNLVRKLRDDYYAALDKYDVLVLPTLVYLPPKLPPQDASVMDMMGNSAGVTLNTSSFNLTGMPALSIPVGFLSHPLDETARLPVGMQIVGKFYTEETLYRVAYAWEQANDWTAFK